MVHPALVPIAPALVQQQEPAGVQVAAALVPIQVLVLPAKSVLRRMFGFLIRSCPSVQP
jgi:hypothetical protein